MKILFTIANMVGGGSERVLANLANDFVNKGHEVAILMTAGNDIAYELDSKVKTFSIGSRTGGSVIGRIKRIFAMRKAFRQDKNQVIVSFGTETNMFALLAGIGLKNKIVISERNDPNQCGFAKIRDMIYPLAEGHVFQTEDAKKCFSKKIQSKSVVIPNPLKEELPSACEGERRKEIAAVGRLTPQKNHKLLLKAFRLFCEKHPDYKLVIFGQGELEQELKDYAKTLELEDKVVWKGFAADVLEQIRESAMYVLSSDYEGISNSLAEAMAIGLPVISTDCPIGGSKMCIEHGVNGMLVPIQDERALAEAMCYLAENEDVAKNMGRKACEIRTSLSQDVISEMWLSVLQ